MGKSFFKSFLGFVIAGLLTTSAAQAFQEGVDYKTVANPQPTETPGKIEVLEFFWYGCPHCYHMEPELKDWLARQPNYVAFRRMPAVLGPNWALDGKVFYAAELLGVLDRIHTPFFKALHEEHIRFNDENSLADWFATQGVKREDFLKALSSFVVDMKVRRAGQVDQTLEINGVPTILVNGKYMTSPSMTGSVEKAFQVIDYLTAREAGVAPKKEVKPEATPQLVPRT
jgi:thiol:disulfide interchange protein DsbA